MIEVLVGMIASGKSTYAQKRADARCGAMVVSHDDLTQMLHARYRYEPIHRNLYRKMMVASAAIIVENGIDVIVDRTHLTRESRSLWIDVARELKVECVAVCFANEGARVHAKRRADHDDRGRTFAEWLEVAAHHARQAQGEPVTDSEGFSMIVRHLHD